jgi:hypothetical protein
MKRHSGSTAMTPSEAFEFRDHHLWYAATFGSFLESTVEGWITCDPEERWQGILPRRVDPRATTCVIHPSQYTLKSYTVVRRPMAPKNLNFKDDPM